MIEVEHGLVPFATWYASPAEWKASAVCLGSGDLFFPDDDEWGPARALCAACTARTACGALALVEEQGLDAELRFGLRAYMTPAQRESIERRGGLKDRDPMQLVLGDDNGRRVPPVPDDGDNWPRHLTTLARKVVRWLIENVEVGGVLPAKSAICDAIGCNPTPLRRVLDALVQDGTLDFARHPRKGSAGQAASYTRRATPRVVGSWLPPHLRGARMGELPDVVKEEICLQH